MIYSAELVLGIEDIHNSHIIHRDLKPENIMLDDKFHLKIVNFASPILQIDFGDANYLEAEEAQPEESKLSEEE